MALKVYAADQVAVTFSGILLEAEGDDQFVTITKTNDTFTYKEGVNGFGTRSRRKGKLFRVEVTLPQTSEKNALLSLLHKADQESNGSGDPQTKGLFVRCIYTLYYLCDYRLDQQSGSRRIPFQEYPSRKTFH